MNVMFIYVVCITYVRCELDLLMIFSRKVFCGATRPRRPPGMSAGAAIGGGSAGPHGRREATHTSHSYHKAALSHGPHIAHCHTDVHWCPPCMVRAHTPPDQSGAPTPPLRNYRPRTHTHPAQRSTLRAQYTWSVL